MPSVPAGRTQLYFEVRGESDVPLVLVHGSWGDHHNWDAVVPALARSHRVVTYDRRGHSRSVPVTGPGSVREDASDLAMLIEALGAAPAHVVGSSFGAIVVLRLAGERPELCRSVLVHEPPLLALLGDDPEARAPLAALDERVAAVIALLRAGDAAAGARRFVETIALGPGAWDTLPEAARQTFVANAHTWLDEVEDPEWATPDLPALSRLECPVLLSGGDQSPPHFGAIVARLARVLPRARQHVFADAGHVPHLSHPAAYVQVVSEFIATVEAGMRPLAALRVDVSAARPAPAP